MDSEYKANGNTTSDDERAKRRKISVGLKEDYDLANKESAESTSAYGLSFLEQIRRTLDKTGRKVTTYFETLPPIEGNEEYYKQTKMPISLEMIEEKLNDGYFKNLTELESCFKRMIRNAKDFFPQASRTFNDAERVRKALSNYMIKTNPAYQNDTYHAFPTPLPPDDEEDPAVEDEDAKNSSAKGEETNKEETNDGDSDESRESESKPAEKIDAEEDDNSSPKNRLIILKRRPGRPFNNPPDIPHKPLVKPDHEYEDKDYKGLSFQQAQEKIVEEMLRHHHPECEGPCFKHFVNLPPRPLKDYYKIISDPLSLKKLQKAVRGKHGRNDPTGVSEFRTWAQFEEKAQLLWNNAYYYNEEGSKIYAEAQALEKFFQDHLKQASTVVSELPLPNIRLKVAQQAEPSGSPRKSKPIWQASADHKGRFDDLSAAIQEQLRAQCRGPNGARLDDDRDNDNDNDNDSDNDSESESESESDEGDDPQLENESDMFANDKNDEISNSNLEEEELVNDGAAEVESDNREADGVIPPSHAGVSTDHGNAIVTPEVEDTPHAEVAERPAWDEPAYFKPPLANGDIPIVKLSRAGLDKMVLAMGTPYWAQNGTRWEEGLVMQDDELAQDWIRRHKNAAPNSLARKMMLGCIQLWRLFHKAPKASDLDAQCEYMRYPECIKSFRKLIHTLEQVVDSICARMSPEVHQCNSQEEEFGFSELVLSMTISLRKFIIPVLILAMKAACITGSCVEGGNGRETGEVLPRFGTFTKTTLHVLIRMSRWLEGLDGLLAVEIQTYQSVRAMREQIDGEDLFRKQSSIFRRNLKNALDRLEEEIHPSLNRKRAMEDDESTEKRRSTSTRKRRRVVENDEPTEETSPPLTQTQTAEDASLEEERRAHLAQRQAMEEWTIEEDHRLRGERAEKQRQRLDQDRRQMALFQASILRVANRNSSGRQTLSETSQWSPRPQQQQQQQQQAACQLTPEEEYREKNAGWYWEEDNLLLSTLKSTIRPDFQGLTGLFPGRGAGEIEARATSLKERYRAIKAKKGEQVPEWACV